tara:strand:+ start:62619 stop:63155 length:537 start_codon:yes stop_codon:yes gene_type:complete
MKHQAQWFPVNQRWRYRQAGAEMSSWLLDPGSLTRRLQCHGNMTVQVLRQAYARPSEEEAKKLNIPSHVDAVIREVLLHCNDEPWIFARSIFPITTLTGAEQRLHHLAGRSLGELLFTSPKVWRAEFDVAKLRQQDYFSRQVKKLTGIDENLWARRSLFYFTDKPIMVNEVFLPRVTQ